MLCILLNCLIFFKKLLVIYFVCSGLLGINIVLVIFILFGWICGVFFVICYFFFNIY